MRSHGVVPLEVLALQHQEFPTVGRDILDFIRGRRALDELPPLSEIEEAHVLAALEAVESAHLTKIAEKKVENAKSDIDREVAA